MEWYCTSRDKLSMSGVRGSLARNNLKRREATSGPHEKHSYRLEQGQSAMKTCISLSHHGAFDDAVNELADLERDGLDMVFVAEAYGFDSVSQLGYIAARTTRLTLAAGILPIYSRSPTLIAMTAAGLDNVSGGRFMLGLGASGPQVIEGFHGIPYDSPLQRTREVIDICRSVWRRDRLEFHGDVFQIPLPNPSGSGLGKPLKLISHPVRERIPILVAAIGPKNVELAAEVAEAWEPIFFYPERAREVWGSSLSAGATRRDPTLGPLETYVSVSVAVGDGTDGLLDSVRPMLALYLGGMGARGKNFYNNLACRYGFEAEAALIQDLYLEGKKVEAEAAVPDELIRATNLIGPEGFVAERLAAFREAGVTGILLQSVDNSSAGRRASLDAIQRLQA